MEVIILHSLVACCRSHWKSSRAEPDFLSY